MDEKLKQLLEELRLAGASAQQIEYAIDQYQLKKKGSTVGSASKPGLNPGSPSESQSSSTNTNPQPPFLSPNQTQTPQTNNDAILEAKKKGEENLAQQQAVINEEFTKKFNKTISPIPKESEMVTLQDGTKINVNNITPQGGLLDINDKSLQAAALQEKINTKTYDDNDIASLAGGAKVIPELVKAKIKNNPLDIAVATFKNQKNNFDNTLKESIEQANLRFGLKDTYEYVTSTPEATREYIVRIGALNEGEKPRVDAARNEAFALKGALGSDKAVGEAIDEQNKLNDIVRQAAYFANNKAIEKIEADNTLTNEQKVQKNIALINGPDYKRANEALANEKQPTFLDKVVNAATIVGNLKYLLSDTDYQRKEKKDALKSFEGVARLALSNKANERFQQDSVQLAQDKRNLAEKTAEQTDGGVFVEEEEGIKKREEELKQRQGVIENSEAIFNEFPSLRKQQVTQLINDYKAQVSGNLDSETTNTADERKKIKEQGLNNYLKDNGVDLDNQVVQDAIEDDRTKSYSWFGGTGKAFADVFISTGKSVGDLVGARDDISRLGEMRLDELMPRTVSESDKYQLDTGTGITQQVGQTTAQVVGQGLLQYGTAGLGRLAGAGKAAAIIGSWTSGSLTSYDDAYKEAYSFTNSQLGRTTYAGLIAFANAYSERIFDDMKLITAIPGVSEGFMELGKKFGTVGFTDAMTNDILGKVKNSILDYGKAYGNNVKQEVLEEGIVSLFTDATKYLYGDKTVTLGNSLQNLKETAIQTATGMIAVGGFGAYADLKKRRNTAEAGTLYNAAVYKDEATAAIEKGFADGLYGDQERVAKMVVLNTAASKLAETKNAENILGRKFSTGEKQLFIANLTAESVYKEQQKNTTSEEVKEAIQIKLDNLKAQQKQIFKGGVTVSEDGTIETDVKPTVPAIEVAPVPATAPKVVITPEVESLVQSVKDGGKIGTFATMPTMDLLQMVAQQAQDLDSKGNVQQSENAEQMRGMAMTSAVRQFGQELVDKAIELFPAPATEVAPAAKVEPIVLTAEQQKETRLELSPDETAQFIKAKKAGTGDEYLLQAALAKGIVTQPAVAKAEFVSATSISPVNTANENTQSNQAANTQSNNAQANQNTQAGNNEENKVNYDAFDDDTKEKFIKDNTGYIRSSFDTQKDFIEAYEDERKMLQNKLDNGGSKEDLLKQNGFVSGYFERNNAKEEIAAQKEINDDYAALVKRFNLSDNINKQSNTSQNESENKKGNQANDNETNGKQSNGQENGQNGNVKSQKEEEVKNGTTATDNAVVSFNPKENQYDALARLTKGIEDLPADQQKAEIEKIAAEHEASYKEFTKGDNKISDENSKKQRVSEFAGQTEKAMAKFLTPAGKKAFAPNKGPFENGSRIDENGKAISENDFVTLKEKVKQLRKEKNEAEIKKINDGPRAYLEDIKITEEQRNSNTFDEIKNKSNEQDKISKRIYELDSNEGKMPESEVKELSELRRERDNYMRYLEIQLQSLYKRYGGETNIEAFSRQDRLQWELLQNELQMGDRERAERKQAQYNKGGTQGPNDDNKGNIRNGGDRGGKIETQGLQDENDSSGSVKKSDNTNRDTNTGIQGAETINESTIKKDRDKQVGNISETKVGNDFEGSSRNSIDPKNRESTVQEKTLNLNFVAEKDLPTIEEPLIKNGKPVKTGGVVVTKEVADPELIKQQQAIKDKLETLEKLVKCLTK